MMYLMKTILLANDAYGLQRLLPLLQGFDVSCAGTLMEAEKLLTKGAFDLIVVGVHFDDSRAVEFLTIVRDDEQHKFTPFVFVKTRPSTISEQLKKPILMLKKFSQVSAYVETDQLKEDDKRIRAAIVSCLEDNERHAIRAKEAQRVSYCSSSPKSSDSSIPKTF